MYRLMLVRTYRYWTLIGIPATGRKCKIQGVALSGIDAFFQQEIVFVIPDIHHSEVEERYIAYGRSPANGWLLFVAFTFRSRKDETLIGPISARYMHEKEARKYEEKNSKI